MNLTLQDLSAILVPTIGISVGFSGLMWRHFDKRIDKLENKIDTVEGRLNTKIDTVESNLNTKIDNLDKKIDAVEERLGEKIDAVRDRVSRVEGQLTPAKVVAFGGIWASESAEQKSVRKQ